MAKIHHSVTINQPVEQVFAFIRDIRNTARWHPSLVSGPFPFKGAITFESLGNATRMAFDADTQPRGFLKLADGMIGGMLQKDLETDLSTAKHVVETGT